MSSCICVFFCSPYHRYIPMTVHNVQITEGKATELNFTLAQAVNAGRALETAHGLQTTGTTTSPSESTETLAVPSAGSKSSTTLPPEHEPIQPQEFRHHSHADMELFLRKYRSDFPSITYLYSVGRSVQGRELYVMVISDDPREHEQGTVSAFCTGVQRGLCALCTFTVFLSFFKCQVNQSLSTSPTCTATR